MLAIGALKGELFTGIGFATVPSSFFFSPGVVSGSPSQQMRFGATTLLASNPPSLVSVGLARFLLVRNYVLESRAPLFAADSRPRVLPAPTHLVLCVASTTVLPNERQTRLVGFQSKFCRFVCRGRRHATSRMPPPRLHPLAGTLRSSLVGSALERGRAQYVRSFASGCL